MFNKKQSSSNSSRSRLFRDGRSLRYEIMEGRLVLSASGFAGNECAPVLNDNQLDQIVPSQAFSPGDMISFEFSAADVVSDEGVGATAAENIRFILDPDLGTRLNGATPEGATLTLNDQGTTDVADDKWQFSWTPASELTGTFRLFLIATDDGGTNNTVPLSDVYSFNISIDDRTSVDINGDDDSGIDFGPVNFSEAGDSAPVSIVDTDLTIPFASGNKITSATVKINSPQADGLETLGITESGDLIVDRSVPGQLTITIDGGGQADKAVFENALKTLTYNNTSDDPEQTRTITITVNDGRGDSLPATATVNIQLANDGPDLLVPNSLPEAKVGEEYVLPLVARDPDSGDLLTYRLISAPAGATIHPLQSGGSDITEQLSADSSGNYNAEIRWTPTVAQGSDTDPQEFLIVVTDSGGLADSKIYSITIENQAPVANNDPEAGSDLFTVNEDAGATDIGNILANDTDVDNDILTVSSATVGNTALTIGSSTTLPSGAEITVAADGKVTYSPNGNSESLAAGQSITETFQYIAADDHNNISSAATVTITITGVNDAPTQTDVTPTFRINEHADSTALSLATILTGVTDVDNGDTHSVVAVPTDPSEGGSFSLTDGVLSFDPNGEIEVDLDDEQTIDFQITIHDANGAQVIIDAKIIIEGMDDVPTAVDDTGFTTNEESTLNVSTVVQGLLNNDSSTTAGQLVVGEVNGDAYPTVKTITIQDASGREGELTVQLDGTFTFDPNGNFDNLAVGQSSQLTFKYRAAISGTQNSLSNEATVTLTITGLNDAPTAGAMAADAEEDGNAVNGNFNGADVDTGEVTSLVYNILSQPTAGSVTNNNDGTFSFDPGDDFQDLAEGITRDVTFNYTATDAQSAVSDAAIVTITVTGDNDAPVIDISDSTGIPSVLPTGSFDSGNTIRVELDLSSSDSAISGLNQIDIPGFTSDVDGDNVGFSLAAGDNGGTAFRSANRPALNSNNHLVWTPTTADIGTNYIIRIQAQDQPTSGALSTSVDIIVSVISSNPRALSATDIDTSLDVSQIVILFSEAMGNSALQTGNYSLQAVDGSFAGNNIGILTATAGASNQIVLTLNDVTINNLTGATKLKLTLGSQLADTVDNQIEGELEFEIMLLINN